MAQKINDDSFVQSMWLMQLKNLSSNVLHNYVGGSKGVCEDSDFWYMAASSTHRRVRGRITDKLGEQQILKRLRDLVKTGLVKTQQELTFMLDTEQARSAFECAREFWIKNGVPTGYQNGKSLTAHVDNLTELQEQCLELLMAKFKSVHWLELEQQRTN